MKRARCFAVAAICLTVVLASAQTAEQKSPDTRPAKKELDWSPVVAAGCRIEWDVPFVEGGGPQQRLDLYAPPNAKDAPVVIFVHGGEWAKRDKIEVSYKPKLFNTAGMVLVSVNYRLSGTAQHPAQVDDVAAAVRWLRDHVAKYGGDPHKLVLMGHSAGCHIVTLVALDPRYLAKVKLTPSDLAGVVSWSGGAFDLPDKVKGGGMYVDYIHKNFGDDEQAWHDASPMFHVAGTKPAPRFLFASAENDSAASREASEKMVGLIREAGGQAERTLLAGKAHSTANYEVGQLGDETGAVLLDFVRRATGGATN
jgi:arylformamidase